MPGSRMGRGTPVKHREGLTELVGRRDRDQRGCVHAHGSSAPTGERAARVEDAVVSANGAGSGFPLHDTVMSPGRVLRSESG